MRRVHLVTADGPAHRATSWLFDEPQTFSHLRRTRVVGDAGAVTKRPHTDWSAKELARLSDEQLAQRHREATAGEARADAPGMGRSVEGRRLWRGDRGLVEEEIARRASAQEQSPAQQR